MIKLKDILKEAVGDFSMSADQMRGTSLPDFDAATLSGGNPKIRAMFQKLESVLDDRSFAGWTDQDVELFLQRFGQWVDVLRYEQDKGKTVNLKSQQQQQSVNAAMLGNPNTKI